LRDKDTGPDSTGQAPVRYATQAEWEAVKAQLEEEARAEAEAQAEALEGVRRLTPIPTTPLASWATGWSRLWSATLHLISSSRCWWWWAGRRHE
jgi:hypothetical protein